RAVTRADVVDVPSRRRERLVHDCASLSLPFATWEHGDPSGNGPLRSPILGMIMTFAEIGVRPELVAALSKQRITEPTAIQIAALPSVASRREPPRRARDHPGHAGKAPAGLRLGDRATGERGSDRDARFESELD